MNTPQAGHRIGPAQHTAQDAPAATSPHTEHRSVDELLRADGTPDWDRTGENIPCSLCDYNLYRLTRPQCPECGLTFAWRDVLDRTLIADRTLFEFAIREQPVKSFLSTFVRTLMPRRFWSHLSPHGLISSLPLWIFAACTLMVLWGGMASVIWFLHVTDIWPQPTGRRFTPRPAPLLIPLWEAAALVVVQWVLYQLLADTKQKLHIRSVHLVRVVAYTTPFIYLPVIAASKCDWLVQGDAKLVILLTGTVFCATYLYSLTIANKCYLRIPHATFVAFTHTIIASLIVVISLVLRSL